MAEEAKITTKAIFEAMPSRFDPEAAGDWSAVIQFDIAPSGDDPGGKWVVTIKDKTVTVTEGTTDSPTATLSTDAETYVGVSTGAISGQTAFFTGKIKIAGNMNDVIKVQTVFKKEV